MASHFPQDYVPEYTEDDQYDEPEYVGPNAYMTNAVLARYIVKSVAVFFCLFAWEGISAGYGFKPGDWLLVGGIVGSLFGWTMWAAIRSVNNISNFLDSFRR